MRLFIALWPPEEVLAGLRALPREEHPSVRWSTEDQWHVTLRFLGNVDDVDAVADQLRAVEHPPLDLRVGPATTRLGPGVLMVPVAGADSLAAALPFPSDHPFRGHLTVARARSRRSIPRALEDTPFEAAWKATSFSLVRSQTKPSGAVYDDVEVFGLR